jgi:hypothetical protein
MTGAVLAAGVETARACSCAIVDPRAALATADGAFVGTLVERRDRPDSGVTLVFRVDERVKGPLGATVAVQTASNSAACGIELPVGAQTGLFLDRDGRAWRSNLCWEVEPGRLRDAARPLPRPTGSGPVTLLVGGSVGEVRSLALDRLGRTLAYGRGSGTVTGFSVCPGARRVAEVAYSAGAWLVAVRELRTLALVQERKLNVRAPATPSALRCESRQGSTLAVFTTSLDSPEQARLLRLSPQGVRTLWRGTARQALLTKTHAYITSGRRGTVVRSVDMRSGEARVVAHVPAFTGPLVASADGSRLAGVASSPPLSASSPPSQVVVVETGVRPARVRTATLGRSNVMGDVFWLSEGRLAFLPRGEADAVRVYDRSLRVVGRVEGWTANGNAVVGSTAFGLGSDGRLLRARLPGGSVHVVRRLPSPLLRVIATV